MKKRPRLSLLEWFVLVALLCLIVIILYPVFVKPDRRPYGFVLDSTDKPMPGAILRFRDGTGRIVATFTADKDGEFRDWKLEDLRHT